MFGQRIRGNNNQCNQLVATSTSVEVRGALTLKPKDLPCLTAGRDLELGLTVQGRYLYLGAEGSLSKVDWQFVEYIVVISVEKLVLFDRQGDIEIARGAASFPGFAFAAEAYLNAIINSGGDGDQNTALVLFLASASALGTALSDDFALAVALGTGSDIGESTENTLLDSVHLPGAITVGASAGLSAWLTAGALT